MTSTSGLWFYLSADPIGLAGGMNLYGYVGGDPVNFVDPEGLAGWHFDGDGKYIHKGKYRFNDKGKLVDHSGRELSKPEKGGNWKDAKNMLDFLKGKKPDFFVEGFMPLIIFPWQIECINNPDKCNPDHNCDDDKS